MSQQQRVAIASTVSASIMKAARKRASIAAKTLAQRGITLTMSGLGEWSWNPISAIAGVFSPPPTKISDLSKFPPEDISNLLTKLGIARWELETVWTENLITAKIAEMKAGLKLLPIIAMDPSKPASEAFPGGPLKPPQEAAKEAFTTGVVNTTMGLFEAAQERVGTTFGMFGDLAKLVPWLAVGAVALFAAPHIIKTVKAVRA